MQKWMNHLKRNEQRKKDKGKTYIQKKMGSLEVYDVNKRNGSPTFRTTINGINILKT